MSKSEYIVWKCESREKIANDHPEWSKKQVENYLRKVEYILKKKGLLTREF